jgi:hypothetical protein
MINQNIFSKSSLRIVFNKLFFTENFSFQQKKKNYKFCYRYTILGNFYKLSFMHFIKQDDQNYPYLKEQFKYV